MSNQAIVTSRYAKHKHSAPGATGFASVLEESQVTQPHETSPSQLAIPNALRWKINFRANYKLPAKNALAAASGTRAFNLLVYPMTTPFEDSGRATQAQSAGASTHATYPLVTTLDWPTCQNSGPRVLDNLSSVMM